MKIRLNGFLPKTRAAAWMRVWEFGSAETQVCPCFSCSHTPARAHFHAWVASAVGLAAGILLASARVSQGSALTIDVSGTNRSAWSENGGWLNGKPTHESVHVFYNGSNSFLSGYAWAENIGWVKVGSGNGPYLNTASNNWGVNMDAQWRLSGYGWAENAGWVRFAATHGRVTIDPLKGGFDGYAWAENLGWIHFTNAAPAYLFQAAIGFATNQVPQWWLWDYGFTNNFDAAAQGDWDRDGAATWEEYVAGTDPTNEASVLSLYIPSPDVQPDAGILIEWPSRSDRRYSLSRSSRLLDVPPFQVVATNLAGSGGTYRFADTNATGPQWYWYRVGVRFP